MIKKSIKPKKEKITTWKKKCDIVFGHFIRKRDAEFGGPCISCGRWFPYEELDAGHFIDRDCLALRYDEKNVNAQCWRCNRYSHGEQALAYKGINVKYGEGTADRLLEIYKDSRVNIKQYTIDFYKKVYEKYKKYR